MKIQTWFLFVIGVNVLLSGFVAWAVIFTLIQANTNYLTPTLFVSFPVAAYLVWRWASQAYDANAVKESLASKRIDIQKGVFSPFSAPLVPKIKNLKPIFIGLMLTGTGLILLPALILGPHWTGRYLSEIKIFGSGVCLYLFLLASLAFIGLSFSEYRWMRLWEKQSGRKITLNFKYNA